MESHLKGLQPGAGTVTEPRPEPGHNPSSESNCAMTDRLHTLCDPGWRSWSLLCASSAHLLGHTEVTLKAHTWASALPSPPLDTGASSPQASIMAAYMKITVAQRQLHGKKPDQEIRGIK